MPHDAAILDNLADVPPERYRRRDRIARAQMWLPVAAVTAVALFWLWGWFRHGDARYLPGPLAHVHATWEHRCDTCHTNAQPLSGQNWAGTLLGASHAADAQCQTCHAGPRHHDNEKPAEVAGCTTCHREHRGRSAGLRRVANEQCTRCHGNLTAHVQDGAATTFLNVDSFLGERHPEFRVLREHGKDPGRIAFNHKLHLAAGLREQANTSVPFVLADIAPEHRERYRVAGQADKDPVKLDCASCHRADGASPERVRAAGDYMLPIHYDRHCQACHPLDFAKEAKGFDRPSVPHRLQPDEVRAWLRGYFTDRLIKDRASLLQQPLRPLPGKNPEREAHARKLADILQENVRGAEAILFGQGACGRCHTSLLTETGATQRIDPANIPTVWFQHARFDHTAHRGVACAVCHVDVEQSRGPADVLLPGVKLCRTCHAPPHAAGGRVAGGARHDCVECHRYHGGDQPLHGRGAALRQPPHGPLPDVQRFLKGSP
ncbi:MAG: cytochrome c3 family protein [Gemmataceae bacterium]|nr:cytochrome c3 family protein [Gemmataceae bacterium]